MRVSNILVTNVTVKQHRGLIYAPISNPNMMVSNILAINVTIRQHGKAVYLPISNLNIRGSNLLVLADKKRRCTILPI